MEYMKYKKCERMSVIKIIEINVVTNELCGEYLDTIRKEIRIVDTLSMTISKHAPKNVH
jgi:hypothetical protein